jgi:cephalosporin hydroxylase|tara:strand:+ start:6 stop:758 length:753 start_codon:yes stop_codon:yes gene_type:complete
MFDKKFEIEKKKIIKKNSSSKKFLDITKKFNIEASLNKYTYNFTWLGVPIIQYPQDMIIMQELLFEVKPDLIIETGVARSGSLIFYSSILSLIHKKYKVIGVDIDIRNHAKKVLKEHKFSKNITTFQGSSNDEKILNKISKLSKKYKKILVCLDSDHTHQHVLDELKNYNKFVSKNSYLVVFDTTQGSFDQKNINKISKVYKYKPWGKNSNPLTAVKEFLKNNKNFTINENPFRKALVSNCYSGFLKKIK